MADFHEKRASPRRQMLLRVTYEDRSLGIDATENLSHGGLFIQTEHPFEMGQSVALAVSFPGLLNPIELMGKVAWKRPAKQGSPAGVGIEVERDEDRRRLASLLSSKDVEETPVYPKEGYRVLIVEDNPHIIEMYSYVLKKLATGALEGQVPLEVDFATDGHQALQKLLAKRFHLVITDLYMPVLDGFALMERIRSDDALRTLPVVVISAAGREAQTRAMDLGVDVYLRKPVKFVEVLDTVKRLLRIQ